MVFNDCLNRSVIGEQSSVFLKIKQYIKPASLSKERRVFCCHVCL